MREDELVLYKCEVLSGITVAELVALLSGFVAKWSRVRTLVRLPVMECASCGEPQRLDDGDRDAMPDEVWCRTCWLEIRAIPW